MTELEKLAYCRVMVNQPAEADGWSDEVLNTYLTIAGRIILNRAYPYDDSVSEVPNRYGIVQCTIATYLLNKRGAEGETAHSENGISRTYASADVPESLLSEVIPHCGLVKG